MEEYEVISYNPNTREHLVRGKSGYYTVDLAVDSSFEGYVEHDTLEKVREYEESFVGKTVLIERFFPLVYAAHNVKIKD